MKYLKRILRWLLILIMIPALYVVVSLILISITINKDQTQPANTNTIYLSTNGVHLEVILPVKLIPDELKNELNYSPNDQFLSFGWGEENFYINTPTWNELKLSTAVNALFLENTTLIHLTRYRREQRDWIKIPVGDMQLNNLQQFIQTSFKKDEQGNPIILPNKGYSWNDDFYKANGRYSLFYTCNTWINEAFKTSGLKACLWTPFDFGLMWKYE